MMMACGGITFGVFDWVHTCIPRPPVPDCQSSQKFRRQDTVRKSVRVTAWWPFTLLFHMDLSSPRSAQLYTCTLNSKPPSACSQQALSGKFVVKSFIIVILHNHCISASSLHILWMCIQCIHKFASVQPSRTYSKLQLPFILAETISLPASRAPGQYSCFATLVGPLAFRNSLI